MTRRTRSMTPGRPALRARPAAVAAGLLAVALAAGCGSSGSGTVAGGPPSSSPSPTASPSEFPGPSSTVTEAPTPSPQSDSLRDFHDAASGVSLTAPVGYVVASTPAEAASRFPAVLGNGADTASKITDAQTRLRSNTIMVAYHAPIGGLFDNIGVIKAAGSAPSDPAEIQSATFQADFRKSLTGAGAKNIVFTDTKLGGQPAENAIYEITPTGGGADVFGQQFYVADDTDVFVVTVTAGTSARAADAADEIASTWSFD
jgi:hypothetical protein